MDLSSSVCQCVLRWYYYFAASAPRRTSDRPGDSMHIRAFARVTALLVLVFAGVASDASAQGGGIKVGPTFDEFSGDSLDFDNRTGIHAGIFFGGGRDNVLGFQTELNWLRKKTEAAGGQQIRIDYLQIPVLLRLNAGSSSASGPAVYGIAGPGIELK